MYVDGMPTIITVPGFVLSARVAANPACKRLRYHHRRKRCCGFKCSPYLRQQKHRIETRRFHGSERPISCHGLADRKLFCSRRKRRVPNAGSRRACAHLGVRIHAECVTDRRRPKTGGNGPSRRPHDRQLHIHRRWTPPRKHSD
jgi:hypothetical protein